MTHQEGVEATVALGVEVAVPVLVKTVLGDVVAAPEPVPVEI
jgi:hypothetical protein